MERLDGGEPLVVLVLLKFIVLCYAERGIGLLKIERARLSACTVDCGGRVRSVSVLSDPVLRMDVERPYVSRVYVST
jgi:hypothetical protein